MDRKSAERAAEIFADAVTLPEDRRAAFIVEACAGDRELLAEVRSLLSASEGASEYFNSLVERLGIGRAASHAEVPRPVTGRPGMKIGPYSLKEPIGHGGSGTVWRAERSDGQFEGDVAIKILKPGAATNTAMGRLGREAQHLATLSHPNIARLLDAGVDDDDRPYLILEYVAGTEIDRYCDEQRLGVDGRIRLFLDVVRAVAHAHAHLIVHRDIKPSNVLVDDAGTVKLLDFGIARLLRPEEGAPLAEATVEITAALTPEYAAPEQLTGRAITTATDVYSLGLLLYVLLAGCHPRRLPAIRSLAALVELAGREPPRASAVVTDDTTLTQDDRAEIARRRNTTTASLQRRLRGDLDNILQKALAPEPGDRFDSATKLADDLSRYLNGEPVSAMPPTVRYRLQKFVGRHRGGVLTACLTAIALLAAVVITTTQMLEAKRQRDIALYQQQRVQASNEFYSLLLEDIGSEGKSFTAVELLDRGADLLDQQYDAAQPFLGRVHYDLSRRYSNLRETNRELELLKLAESAARSNGDDDLLAAALCSTANATLDSAPDDARAKVAEGNFALARSTSPSIDSRIACLRMDARLAEADGDRDRAIDILHDVRRRLEESESFSAHLHGITLNDLANLYFKSARYDESLAVLDEILALLSDSGRGNTLGYLQILSNRAVLLGTVGEVALQLEARERILQRLEEANWSDGRARLQHRNQYGSTLIRLSRFDEGIAILEAARDEAQALGNELNVAMADLRLADAYTETGRYSEAELRVAAAEEFVSRNPRMWEYQSTRIELIRAEIAREQGRLDDARSLARTVLDRYEYPPVRRHSASLASAIEAAAKTELVAGNYAAAERLATDYLEIKGAAARRPESSADVGHGLALRARARLGQGNYGDAQADAERAIVALENGLGGTNRETLEARELLRETRGNLQ